MIIKNKSQIQQHFFLSGAFCFVFKFSRSLLCSSVVLQWIIAFPLKIEHGIELPLEKGSSDFLLFFMKLADGAGEDVSDKYCIVNCDCEQLLNLRVIIRNLFHLPVLENNAEFPCSSKTFFFFA